MPSFKMIQNRITYKNKKVYNISTLLYINAEKHVLIQCCMTHGTKLGFPCIAHINWMFKFKRFK